MIRGLALNLAVSLAFLQPAKGDDSSSVLEAEMKSRQIGESVIRLHYSGEARLNSGNMSKSVSAIQKNQEVSDFPKELVFPINRTFWFDVSRNRFRKHFIYSMFAPSNSSGLAERDDDLVLVEGELLKFRAGGDIWQYQKGSVDTVGMALFKDAIDLPIYASFGFSCLHKQPSNFFSGESQKLVVEKVSESNYLVQFEVPPAKAEILYGPQFDVIETRAFVFGTQVDEIKVTEYIDVGSIRFPKKLEYVKFGATTNMIMETGVSELVESEVIEDADDSIYAMSIPDGKIVLDDTSGDLMASTPEGLVPYRPPLSNDGIGGGGNSLGIVLGICLLMFLVALVISRFKNRRN